MAGRTRKQGGAWAAVEAGAAMLVTAAAVGLCGWLLVVFFRTAFFPPWLRWTLLGLTAFMIFVCLWLCRRYLDSK